MGRRDGERKKLEQAALKTLLKNCLNLVDYSLFVFRLN